MIVDLVSLFVYDGDVKKTEEKWTVQDSRPHEMVMFTMREASAGNAEQRPNTQGTGVVFTAQSRL